MSIKYFFLCEYIVKCNLFLMRSWIFNIITPVFSITLYSEIIILHNNIAAQETLLIIFISVKTVVLLHIFVETVMYFSRFFDV